VRHFIRFSMHRIIRFIRKPKFYSGLGSKNSELVA